jgi:hypothetical protein
MLFDLIACFYVWQKLAPINEGCKGHGSTCGSHQLEALRRDIDWLLPTFLPILAKVKPP